MPEQKSYLCIDLKSFYASVECVDRGLDPFETDLVVADPKRSENTICLAITPALKAKGVPNRCRVRQIPDGMDYITAIPRMRRYMEVSAQIYRIYLEFVSPDDIYPYSIDEVLVDATPYTRLYDMSARQLARAMIGRVRERTGVTATAGIGPNLFLAKVALDLTAKHARDGIGELDEESFRREIWFHHPITDIWGIGHGIARRLASRGIFDLAGICAERPEILRRMFGKNAEYLIDHAWGLEPATMADIRSYQPRGHSMTNGQVLMKDYSKAQARTILREMAYDSCLELKGKALACDSVGLYVGYSASMYRDELRRLPPAEARRARWVPLMHAGGQSRLPKVTASERVIVDALLALFDDRVDERARIRRVNLSLGGLVPEHLATQTLFDDVEAERREDHLARAMVAVRDKFGKNALLRGTSLRKESNARERNGQVGGHRA